MRPQKSLKERMIDKLEEKPSTLGDLCSALYGLSVSMVAIEITTQSLKESGVIE